MLTCFSFCRNLTCSLRSSTKLNSSYRDLGGKQPSICFSNSAKASIVFQFLLLRSCNITTSHRKTVILIGLLLQQMVAAIQTFLLRDERSLYVSQCHRQLCLNFNYAIPKHLHTSSHISNSYMPFLSNHHWLHDKRLKL